MARSKTTASSTPSSRPDGPLKTAYLVLYNVLSALLWTVVLTQTVSLMAEHRTMAVHPAVGEWTKWTQTLALVEVVHALIGEWEHETLRLRTMQMERGRWTKKTEPLPA